MGYATSAITAREREVALLAATNTPSKDIAETLHLSVRTVNNHLRRGQAAVRPPGCVLAWPPARVARR